MGVAGAVRGGGSDRQCVVVLMDGIDQLRVPRRRGALPPFDLLSWLPEELPDNFRLGLSALEEESLARHARVRGEGTVLALPPLRVSARAALVEALAMRSGLRLQLDLSDSASGSGGSERPSRATRLAVSGAHEPRFDGEYRQQGYGARWRNFVGLEGQNAIRFSSSRGHWELIDSSGLAVYTNTLQLDVPPATGWQRAAGEGEEHQSLSLRCLDPPMHLPQFLQVATAECVAAASASAGVASSAAAVLGCSSAGALLQLTLQRIERECALLACCGAARTVLSHVCFAAAGMTELELLDLVRFAASKPDTRESADWRSAKATAVEAAPWASPEEAAHGAALRHVGRWGGAEAANFRRVLELVRPLVLRWRGRLLPRSGAVVRAVQMRWVATSALGWAVAAAHCGYFAGLPAGDQRREEELGGRLGRYVDAGVLRVPSIDAGMPRADLGHCSVAVADAAPIEAALALAPGPVVTAAMRSNRLGDRGTTAVARLLGRPLCALAHLDLANNRVMDLGAEALAAFLQDNITLQTLDLENNRIGPRGAQALAEALGCNLTLQCLRLERNCITDEGAGAFALLLKGDPAITVLNLCDNDIGEDGVRVLGMALRSNTALRTLDVSLNFGGNDG